MTLRDRQAQQARQLIIGAATDCFLENGYVGTTMDDIAERAAVARRTIYNQFGSKAALLVAAINDRVVGSEERSLESDHNSVRALDDPRQMIEAFIRAHVGVVHRSLPLLKVTFEAAAIDGEVAKEYERNEDHRYRAQQVLIDALDRKGLLRTDVPLDYLKRGFWLLAGPQMLITASNAGWDIDTYARWLKETVSGLLLPQHD
ncbi:MAG TPA: helix-turn-helix domain-containing protein [Acidimicrobiia bacterium]|nr:helix-turn-helix domain-containing protein [Acidimicrobiia bacterium]